MKKDKAEKTGSQNPGATVIQFPRSGKYPESALVKWILSQFTLEEIKGFILHQFDADYYVNKNRFRRFVKLCKLVDSERIHKEQIQKHPPVSDRSPMKYNEPFVASSFPHRESRHK